ncbi:hypothetical protein ACFLRZ_04720, partial [Bacteroidota bacterium]
HDERKKKREIPKLYSINKVAKMLGKSHATIKKLVDNKIIETTRDGWIPETSINKYLSQF